MGYGRDILKKKEEVSMQAETVLNGILLGNYHRGGMKCRRLFRVEESFFARLVAEVKLFVEKFTPSCVQDANHVTNWTRPYGTAVQFSLLNESGCLDDFDKDHNWTRKGKRFHYAADFPTMAKFIDAFPHAYNMRLNGMGKKSGLSLHEEHVVFPTADGRQVQVRARFHLPILTSQAVEMVLDGEAFHFEAGSIFFFNNGCIHSATNAGDTFRYHFVWDTLLTEVAYQQMFADYPSERGCDFLERLEGEQALCQPLHPIKIGEYQPSGEGKRLYDKLRLKYLLVKPHSWQNLYNALEFRRVAKKPLSWWHSYAGSGNDYGHNIKD
jgi:hypothetical protein